MRGTFGEHRDKARAVGQHYADRYGGGQEFLDTLRTDPAGVALDIGGVLTGGAAAGARLPGTAGRVAQAIVKADPVAAGGRAVGRAVQARRGVPSTKQFLLIHESPLTDALFLLVSKSDEVTTT